MTVENLKTDTTIMIDVGNLVSGIAIVSNKKILCGFIEPNNSVTAKITQYYIPNNTMVVIEDIRPYSKPLSMQTIDTIKFVGELSYRLRSELQMPFSLITRSEVKQWAFDRFPALCSDRIDKKILLLHERAIKKGKRGYKNADGSMRKPSHNYVDDRIVIACMKLYWGIDTPKPGQKNKLGLKAHSWQALACGTVYIDKKSRNEAAI